MKYTLTSILFLTLSSLNIFSGTISKTDSNGFKYKTVENDPFGVRIYTLENGLTVYLARNKQSPRIQSFIAVKAGSTFDPKENTGLAHYLEHMMFKGTDKIGTKDWEKEKPLLEEIEQLYEDHKSANSLEEKKLIYKKIDSVSLLASQFAIANEYDKLASTIGASGTNAYTSFEKTVYINNIPSNELERYLELESQRFGKLVLRLFHTELEAVYEEFNMGQDNDYRKAYQAFFSSLFKNHPYGTQTTIGTAEHLKNPSMKNIHAYWNKYYVPNNMALCMSGDLDFEETIKLVNKTFGTLKAQKIEPRSLPKETEITSPQNIEVYGPNAEFMMMGYRANGVKHPDSKYLYLIDYILSSGGKAGLIDLDLVKTQKVLKAACGAEFMNDYGYQIFYGFPREGQTLDEVRKLLLGEIEKIKKGEFDEWQLEAAINDIKLNEIRSLESNKIADQFVHCFTNNISWEDNINFREMLSKITKQDLVDFANRFYKSNDITVYKRTGKDSTTIKVEKPEITPVPINREDESDYFKALSSKTPEGIKPVFLDFEKDLYRTELAKGKEFFYKQNETNELFGLYYIIEIGKKNDKLLPLAVSYLNYLGTKKYSNADFSKLFYRNGLEYGVNAGNDRCYVYISGLDHSFEKGLELINELISGAIPDQQIYNQMVEDILKARTNAKQDKHTILWKAMLNHALYKDKSPFKDILSEEELKAIDPKELTELIHSLLKYPHSVFYYGQREAKDIEKTIKKTNKDKVTLSIPAKQEPTPLPTDSSIVYFVDYDMVQSEIIMLSRGEKFDLNKLPYNKLFNQYFGSGLSSIVFQELRESKALAYRAASMYQSANETDKYDFVFSYIGTNADKLENAINAMTELMTEMPKAKKQFEQSKQQILKQYETQRIVKEKIFFTYRSYQKMGANYDIRKDIYDKTKSMTLTELEEFFNSNIAKRKFIYLVLGNKKDIDFSTLEKLGPVQELELDNIYGY